MLALAKYAKVLFFSKLCVPQIGKPYDPSKKSRCDGSSNPSFMMDLLGYFTFQPVLYDWCNKGCVMLYPVCGMVHIKEPLLLIEKSSPCGGSRFPLSRYLNGPLPYV